MHHLGSEQGNGSQPFWRTSLYCASSCASVPIHLRTRIQPLSHFHIRSAEVERNLNIYLLSSTTSPRFLYDNQFLLPFLTLILKYWKPHWIQRIPLPRYYRHLKNRIQNLKHPYSTAFRVLIVLLIIYLIVMHFLIEFDEWYIDPLLHRNTKNIFYYILRKRQLTLKRHSHVNMIDTEYISDWNSCFFRSQINYLPETNFFWQK